MITNSLNEVYAAPELLATCKLMEKHIIDKGWSTKFEFETLNKLSTAIAKAEGNKRNNKEVNMELFLKINKKEHNTIKNALNCQIQWLQDEIDKRRKKNERSDEIDQLIHEELKLAQDLKKELE